LGVTVPPSIQEIGAEREFKEMTEKTEAVHVRLKGKAGRGADYILTNAHRRRVLLKVNARELYHISRLREDATAQWDIRAVAESMNRLARKAMPLTSLLLGGKDSYPAEYKKLFGENPKFFPPEF